jgi:hypothetical protein
MATSGSFIAGDSHLRLLARAGVIDKVQAERPLATFDEVRAMTWRLLIPRRG